MLVDSDEPVISSADHQVLMVIRHVDPSPSQGVVAHGDVLVAGEVSPIVLVDIGVRLIYHEG